MTPVMYLDISGYKSNYSDFIMDRIIEIFVPGLYLGQVTIQRYALSYITDKLDVTVAIGFQLEAAFGIGGIIGMYFVSDAEGEQAIQYFYGGGAGFPNASAALFGSISSANSYKELEGLGFSIGASGGVPYTVGVDLNIGVKGDDYNAPIGITPSIGVGLLPYVEEHGYVTYTNTLYRFD